MCVPDGPVVNHDCKEIAKRMFQENQPFFADMGFGHRNLHKNYLKFLHQVLHIS
jgi:hypothetical protein